MIMKKRLLALFVAVTMLLCFSFAGCNKPEKTAEEYLTEAFEQLFAANEENTAAEFIEKMNLSGRTTVSVGNIEPLLALAGVDAATLPPISDVALDVYVGKDGKYGVESISAMIGDTLCDITAYIDVSADAGTIMLSSAQVENVYSVKLEELAALAGAEMPYSLADLAKYDNAYFETLASKYAEQLKTLVFDNAELTKEESGDNVVVTLKLDAEGLATVMNTLCDTVAADTDIIEFVTAMYGEETAAELGTLGEQADAFADELTEAGAGFVADFTIDRSTSAMSAADIEVTADENTVNIALENSDDSLKATVAIDGEIVTFEITEKGFTVVGTMEGSTEESVNISLTVDSGEAVLTCTVEGTEMFAMTGKYESTETTFTYALEEVVVEDITLDLAEAEIAVNVDLGATAPEMPEATASLLELSEEELQNLLFEFIINSGLLSYMAY